ncbi:MAG TPA: hypothetical protein VMT58_02980, partial [Candidatus Binataceae bacterium]|nr:hypothetical protein [Candidatus Binataceae bacterium]
MPVTIATGRGIYFVEAASPIERVAGAAILTLSLKRADGIETICFRCRISDQLLGGADNSTEIVERLVPWLDR